MDKIPILIQENMDMIRAAYQERPMIYEIYRNCIVDTLQTTLQPHEDGTTFVITGDIQAMWLRDSAAQVRPLLFFCRGRRFSGKSCGRSHPPADAANSNRSLCECV
jgi:meiotically up-regulated gene 157 (Mug157) protein